MLSYLVRRLLMMVPILLGISVISFAIMYVAPGQPAVMNLDPTISVEARARQIEALGLNEPPHVQYVKWLGNVLSGNLGTSFTRRVAVADMILERLPNTLLLMVASALLAIAIAIPIGVLSARKPYTPLDYSVTFGAFLGLATPNFWLGLMLIMVFSVQLGLTPVGGVATIGAEFSVLDRLRHLILPAVVLATADMAALTRYTRSSMLEVLSQDYIRTARAKGLPERTVILRHALRNSLIPVITLLGLYLPFLFSGTVFVETIFAWPGMGREIVNAIAQRDYPLVMATSFLFALLVVIGNLLADVLYAVADPRIRYD